MNAMYRGRISARTAAAVGAALFCAFAIQWPLGLLRGLGVGGVAADAGALAMFVTACWRTP